MQLPVCSVFDKKTGLYEQPFVCRHVAEAIREWDIVRKNPETKFGKNPEDFDLIHVAHYDDSKSTFENLQPHYPLSSGV